MSRGVWEAVETEIRKIGVAKAKRERSKKRKRGEERRKGEEEETNKRRSEEEVKKLVPEWFHKQIKVFGKKTSKRMPTRKAWDHMIDLKKGFTPRKEKVYSLSREEKEEIREFIQKQMRKGYIRPSKSSQIAPMFFVGKKDEKKRMMQDYQYLNKWMVKNNYPLPLISDIVENISMKKVFIKLYLRWRYNNMRIKKRNK